MSRINQAVGFIEADGTIQISTEGRVTIEVEQVDPRPLCELQRELGGVISRRGTRNAYRWRLSQKDHVTTALLAIASLGWGVKRDQAQIARQFLLGRTKLANTRNVLSALKATTANTNNTKGVSNDFRFQPQS